MNAAEWVIAGTAVAGLIVQLIVGVYFYGGLSRAVKGHDDELSDVAKDQKDQWSHIGVLREDVGRVKGVLGINGGAHVPNKYTS